MDKQIAFVNRDLELSLYLKTATGDAIDITGTQWEFHIRPDNGITPVVSATSANGRLTIGSAAGGRIDIEIPAAAMQFPSTRGGHVAELVRIDTGSDTYATWIIVVDDEGFVPDAPTTSIILQGPSSTIIQAVGAPAGPGRHVGIAATLDGGGAVLTPGVKGDIEVPFLCTLEAATLLADVVGDLVVDIWMDDFADFPPTVGDSIVGAAPPTLSSASKSQDTTLTGWTKIIPAGSILRYNVVSCSLITRANLSLKAVRG